MVSLPGPLQVPVFLVPRGRPVPRCRFWGLSHTRGATGHSLRFRGKRLTAPTTEVACTQLRHSQRPREGARALAGTASQETGPRWPQRTDRTLVL